VQPMMLALSIVLGILPLRGDGAIHEPDPVSALGILLSERLLGMPRLWLHPKQAKKRPAGEEMR